MPGTRCAVYGCSNTYFTQRSGERCTFHRFPKSKDFTSEGVRGEWIARCRRSDQFNPDTSYICSVHFTEHDYERDLQHELLGLPLRRILKKDAIPTLGLCKETIEASPSKTKKLPISIIKKESDNFLNIGARLPDSDGKNLCLADAGNLTEYDATIPLQPKIMNFIPKAEK